MYMVRRSLEDHKIAQLQHYSLIKSRDLSLAILLDPIHNTTPRASASTGTISIACCRPTARNASVMLAEPASVAARRAMMSLSLPVSTGPSEAQLKELGIKVR